jgi:hypothetical protein
MYLTVEDFNSTNFDPILQLKKWKMRSSIAEIKKAVFEIEQEATSKLSEIVANNNTSFFIDALNQELVNLQAMLSQEKSLKITPPAALQAAINLLEDCENIQSEMSQNDQLIGILDDLDYIEASLTSMEEHPDHHMSLSELILLPDELVFLDSKLNHTEDVLKRAHSSATQRRADGEVPVSLIKEMKEKIGSLSVAIFEKKKDVKDSLISSIPKKPKFLTAVFKGLEKLNALNEGLSIYVKQFTISDIPFNFSSIQATKKKLLEDAGISSQKVLLDLFDAEYIKNLEFQQPSLFHPQENDLVKFRNNLSAFIECFGYKRVFLDKWKINVYMFLVRRKVLDNLRSPFDLEKIWINDFFIPELFSDFLELTITWLVGLLDDKTVDFDTWQSFLAKSEPTWQETIFSFNPCKNVLPTESLSKLLNRVNDRLSIAIDNRIDHMISSTVSSALSQLEGTRIFVILFRL